MLLRAVAAACSILVCGTAYVSHAQQPVRPKVLGLAHIALASHDLQKSRAFYSGFLGFDEVSNWKNPDGTTAFTFFKINDHQYVELTPEKVPGTDRLGDISFETDDLEGMRQYLDAKGVRVPPQAKAGRIGNLSFQIADPAGHVIEFVQYLPTGQTAQNFGKDLGKQRVSMHMTHAGLIVSDLDPEYRFYTDVLGFQETWRGSSDGKVLSWINLKAPDSPDYVEFMLAKPVPAPTARGSAHHLCLVVPSVEKSTGRLKKRAADYGYSREIESHLGRNRKRQSNLFDPDGTRVEIMEPVTVDGTPTPPSTAPPPA